MSNPRKFSEKIAMHTQKQAEGTAAFEAILREVSATTKMCVAGSAPTAAAAAAADKPTAAVPQATAVPQSPAAKQQQSNQLLQQQLPKSETFGRSLPNVNQMSSRNSIDLQNALSNLADMKQAMKRGGRPLSTEQLNRDSRSQSQPRKLLPLITHRDTSPYRSAFLTAPSDASWRRASSDSAIHARVQTGDLGGSGGQQYGVGGGGGIRANGQSLSDEMHSRDESGTAAVAAAAAAVAAVAADSSTHPAVWDKRSVVQSQIIAGSYDIHRVNVAGTTIQQTSGPLLKISGHPGPPQVIGGSLQGVGGTSGGLGGSVRSIDTRTSSGVALQVTSSREISTASLPDLASINFSAPLFQPLPTSLALGGGSRVMSAEAGLRSRMSAGGPVLPTRVQRQAIPAPLVLGCAAATLGSSGYLSTGTTALSPDMLQARGVGVASHLSPISPACSSQFSSTAQSPTLVISPVHSPPQTSHSPEHQHLLQQLQQQLIMQYQQLPALGLAADQQLPALGLAADQQLPALGLAADQQLPALGLAADQQLPTLSLATVEQQQLVLQQQQLLHQQQQQQAQQQHASSFIAAGQLVKQMPPLQTIDQQSLVNQPLSSSQQMVAVQKILQQQKQQSYSSAPAVPVNLSAIKRLTETLQQRQRLKQQQAAAVQQQQQAARAEAVQKQQQQQHTRQAATNILPVTHDVRYQQQLQQQQLRNQQMQQLKNQSPNVAPQSQNVHQMTPGEGVQLDSTTRSVESLDVDTEQLLLELILGGYFTQEQLEQCGLSLTYQTPQPGAEFINRPGYFTERQGGPGDQFVFDSRSAIGQTHSTNNAPAFVEMGGVRLGEGEVMEEGISIRDVDIPAILLSAGSIGSLDMDSTSSTDPLNTRAYLGDSFEDFSAEDALRLGLDPLASDELEMLEDPSVITDQATEEMFRQDQTYWKHHKPPQQQ